MSAPVPRQIAIADLRPTQATAGMREVEIKRMRWRDRAPDKATDYLRTHPIPVVLGPDRQPYMIDRHHLTMALHEEGVGEIPVLVVANLSGQSAEGFWVSLEACNWTHPFDDEGCRCPFQDMPTSIASLTDDPFRSLAGAVKRAGGYVKNKAPFSEFRWADFLRGRIDRNLVENSFGRALAIAMNVAQSTEAAGLPGWRRHPEH